MITNKAIKLIQTILDCTKLWRCGPTYLIVNDSNSDSNEFGRRLRFKSDSNNNFKLTITIFDLISIYFQLMSILFDIFSIKRLIKVDQNIERVN